MSDTHPHDELDLEALARGDRVAADVLVERCRDDRNCIFDPDVFAALLALFKARPLARAWEALLAQLRSVHVDVSALKRALSAADDDDDDDGNEGDSQAERLLGIADQCEYFLDEFGTPYMSFEHSLPEGGARLETTRIESRRGGDSSSRSTSASFASLPLTLRSAGFSRRSHQRPRSVTRFAPSSSGGRVTTALSTSIAEPRTGPRTRSIRTVGA